MLGVFYSFYRFEVMAIQMFMIESMKQVKLVTVHVDLANPKSFPKGFVDKDKLDATTEAQIRLQGIKDDLELVKNMLKSESNFYKA
jgi:hypothetical protein